MNTLTGTVTGEIQLQLPALIRVDGTVGNTRYKDHVFNQGLSPSSSFTGVLEGSSQF